MLRVSLSLLVKGEDNLAFNCKKLRVKNKFSVLRVNDIAPSLNQSHVNADLNNCLMAGR